MFSEYKQRTSEAISNDSNNCLCFAFRESRQEKTAAVKVCSLQVCYINVSASVSMYC